MKNNEMGLYVHIPFCRSKCVYCDFLSSPQSEDVKRAYVEKLIEEIRMCGNGKKVKTVFLGGGTPSCLYPRYIVRIMNAIRDTFDVDDDAEITIECNPGTVDEEKAESYIEAGINRISFGVQSLNDDELKMLGRSHTSVDFYRSLNIVRRAGFRNISSDIITALPGQKIKNVSETLKKLIDVGVNHISAYSLIVEEGTYLYNHMDKFPELPDEDEERQMYYVTEQILSEAGFMHYEISNFAKPGYESRHNLIYWDRGNYLGLGLGASSLIDNVRYSNNDVLKEYMEIRDISKLRQGITKLSLNDQMSEYAFLGLRKMSGINAGVFWTLFGKNLDDIFGDVIDNNIENGLLKRNKDDIFLTDRGIDLSNVVMSDFILD